MFLDNYLASALKKPENYIFVFMKNTNPIAVFWFRRDLRIYDNMALFHALTSGFDVLPVFIFDTVILKSLPHDDKRVSYIYQAIRHINNQLAAQNKALRILSGTPVDVFRQLLEAFNVRMVFANHDYEPYAIERDLKVKTMLLEKGVSFHTFKDQVIFEKNEVVKPSGDPYTVFTPYSQRWLEKLSSTGEALKPVDSEKYLYKLLPAENEASFNLDEIGFTETKNIFRPFELNRTILGSYPETRNYPALDSTSRAGVHLRFGTISIREMVSEAQHLNATWLNELVWREFFMQILWHFPHVVHQPFKQKYQFIQWQNDEKQFERWCKGMTGFPLVDAGMRELNATGFMHNRVRMVTASFLVKHLLVNWQWGEAYFAEKLLDFDLSANNGNWQWAAGTGCDAAPYFRIFNPASQAQKFDEQGIYIRKWVPEIGTSSYPEPIIDHSVARARCLETYKTASEHSI